MSREESFGIQPEMVYPKYFGYEQVICNWSLKEEMKYETII